MLFIIIVSGFLVATLSFGQDRRISPSQEREVARYRRISINPALEVPYLPHQFRWVVQSMSKSEENSTVPVFQVDEEEGRLDIVGNIPVGTEVKLEHFMVFQGRNFYSYEMPAEGQGAPKSGWLDGLYIKRQDPAPATNSPTQTK